MTYIYLETETGRKICEEETTFITKYVPAENFQHYQFFINNQDSIAGYFGGEKIKIQKRINNKEELLAYII